MLKSSIKKYLIRYGNLPSLHIALFQDELREANFVNEKHGKAFKRKTFKPHLSQDEVLMEMKCS
jgi:hypothetical protein